VGNRTGMSHENGIQTAYAYDELNRLTSLTHKDSANVTLRDFSYTLLANGRREKITEANGRVTDYTFDDVYRLTQETIFDPVNPSHNAAYTYDKVGNRTFEVINGVSTAYTIDANDRLIQTGGTVYTHDAQGNTLTETLDGNVTSYSYNAKQELTASVKEGITTAYLYNVNGMRVGQGNATNQTLYTLDTNRAYAQVVQETTDGAPAVTYTYGDDLVSQKRDTLSTYHYDGLGSTRALSNELGGLSDSYDYDVFGEVLNQTGSTQNNYLFTGEQFDSNLDQYYLRARYYDQGIGRFTQMDTWMGNNSDPVTLHKYLYGNVDPVNFVDPSGNFGLGSFSAAARVNGILSAVSVTQTAFDVFSLATSGEEFSVKDVGITVLISLGGAKVAKIFGRRLMKKAGCNKPGSKNLFCDFVKPAGQRIKKYRKLFGIGKRRNIAFADYITSSGFGTVVAHSGGFSQPGTVATPGASRRYQTGFVGFSRSVDSEVKIYESLGKKFNSKTVGLVSLGSERKICRSCGRVGLLFRGDFRRVFLLERGGF
jgi:RHS repeat-associated protein